MQPDGDSFVLGQDATFEFGNSDARIAICVPKGFSTDLASIPSWAGAFGFDKLGKHSRPAILHDYLFVVQAFEFETVNALFREALRAEGVSSFRATVMAIACEIGGKKRWKQIGRDRANAAKTS
jgi:hypothetical protein